MCHQGRPSVSEQSLKTQRLSCHPLDLLRLVKTKKNMTDMFLENWILMEGEDMIPSIPSRLCGRWGFLVLAPVSCGSLMVDTGGKALKG